MNSFDSTSFKKFDLHIHTPSSLCYSDVTVRPEQIVEDAIATGLDAIGITDHNTARGIDEIRRVSDKTKLAVFPGIELTTKGGHFLAIFEIDTPVIKIDKLLDTIGIEPEFRGDGAIQIPGETVDIFKTIVDKGGLVIAAHIERWPSGFLETKESRSSKMALHAHPLLSALEITVPESKEQWNNGLIRGYPKKYACIQGSDAHAPSEVGRRPFLVRTEQIGLAVLKSAFAYWDNVIVFPDQVSRTQSR
jgi:histidinol phosphatase-like PHP family hydrolase